jgi:AraC-like DNA-binding protein
MHFYYSKTGDIIESEGVGPLKEFPFITDFGFVAFKDFKTPLDLHYNEGLEICYVTKGRYDWIVEDKKYQLLPGSGFVTCPWQMHGSTHQTVDLGEVYWIVIRPKVFLEDGKFSLGNWSRFSAEDNARIGDILSNNKNNHLLKANTFLSLFENLKEELVTKRFGYKQRIYNITEEFLINTIHLIQNSREQVAENQCWFKNFKSILSQNISKKWSLKEIAEKTGVGVTTLTQRVKEHTGYSPANYLIFLRIEKSKEDLSGSHKKLLTIALDCGFYSSQHFSSTFSKWVGMSPNAYRKQFNRLDAFPIPS